MDMLVEAVSGLVATALSEAIMTPLDACKTLQQESATPLSLIAAAAQLLAQRGFRGLWAGAGPFLVFNALGGMLKFGVYEPLNRYLARWVPRGGAAELTANYVTAAVAFLATTLVIVPGELIKTRLYLGAYSGLGHAVTSLYAEGGVRAFFTGYFAVCVRDIPYTMLELGLYETTQAAWRWAAGKPRLSAAERMAAAALTGAATGWITNPLDLVKTRLMSTGRRGGGVLQCFREAHRESGLFAGAGARAWWLLICFPIYFGLYELSVASLQRWRRRRAGGSDAPASTALTAEYYREKAKVAAREQEYKNLRTEKPRLGGEGDESRR